MEYSKVSVPISHLNLNYSCCLAVTNELLKILYLSISTKFSVISPAFKYYQHYITNA